MSDGDLAAIRTRADDLRATLAQWSDPLRIAAARIAELEADNERLLARVGELEAEKLTALKLLNYALHLCANGERAPGGNETWREFAVNCEQFLRTQITGGVGK